MAIIITPEDIAARINGYQLTDTSTPNRDTVSEVIEEDLAYVLQLAASKGVVIEAGSAQETYLRGLVIRLVSAKAELMRNRQTSSYALDVQDKAMADITSFMGRAANLANADTGVVDKPASDARPNRCNRTPNPLAVWRKGGQL